MPTNVEYIKNKDFLQRMWKEGRISGSWILSGIQGLGKATLVKEIASLMLSNGQDSTTIASAINDKPNPDLLYIERALTDTEEKDRAKIINSGKELDPEIEQSRKRKPFITVDEIRKIDDFIHFTSSSFDGVRIIVIDSADEMNRNAANALLKALEEPPQNTVIFLIAHKIASLLPTIISRCRIITFSPLSDNEIATIVKEADGTLSDKTLKNIIYLAKGSPGRALFLLENKGEEILNGLLDLFCHMPNINLGEVFKFADKYVKDEKSYNLVREIYLDLLTEALKATVYKEDTPAYLTNELKDFVCSISALLSCEDILTIIDKNKQLYRDTDNLFLDKRQTLISSLLYLGEKC